MFWRTPSCCRRANRIRAPQQTPVMRIVDRFIIVAGNQEYCMTPQEHIAKMTTAIRLAIKVMGDRFGSTEQDVATAIQELKTSMQASAEPRAHGGDAVPATQSVAQHEPKT